VNIPRRKSQKCPKERSARLIKHSRQEEVEQIIASLSSSENSPLARGSGNVVEDENIQELPDAGKLRTWSKLFRGFDHVAATKGLVSFKCCSHFQRL
jgi:hypothetical protein